MHHLSYSSLRGIQEALHQQKQTRNTMMSVNIEGEHVREDAGMGSLADVSCHVCELGSMGEVYGG